MHILSRIQAKPLLDARKAGLTEAETSLDLNRSTVKVMLNDDGVALPDGVVLSWDDVRRVADKDDNCFAVEVGEVSAITRFSHAFNRSYTLRATAAAPTLLIAGFPMHRIKGITPDKDTEAKIAAAGPIPARVLDTATGLGYTAIGCARRGARVTTVELDPLVLTVGRYNPWSAELFDNPAIEQRTGSSFEVIKTFPDSSFDLVLHDPPTFALAGELYSEEFYRQVHRILRPGGRFFHYVGDLESRSGRVVSKGVVRRVLEVGFKRVVRRPEAFALITTK